MADQAQPTPQQPKTDPAKEQPKKEQAKKEQPKKEQPKLYFKFLPKPEVLNFLNSFKQALSEIPKSDEKKNLLLEIKGTNEELKGVSLEAHCLEKGKFKEIFDMAQEHIQKALCILSISFKTKDVKPIKDIYDKFEPTFKLMPVVKKHPENYEIHFRNNGELVYIDITSVKGEFLEPIVGLGLDMSEYQKFDCYFKSGFCPDDFFNLPIEELSLKVIEFAIKISSDSTGIRQIISACIQALKGINLANAQFQKKLEEHIEKLNMLNAFVSLVFSFEFDAKELCAQGLKAASETILKGVDINKRLEEVRQQIIGMGQNVIKPWLEAQNLVDAVKAVNVDEVNIYIGFPKYENGIVQSIQLPGFSEAFVKKIFG